MGFTNLSILPSPIFNLVKYLLDCLGHYYYKDEHVRWAWVVELGHDPKQPGKFQEYQEPKNNNHMSNTSIIKEQL